MGLIKNKYLSNKNLAIVSINVWLVFTLICVASVALHSYPVVKVGCLYIIAVLLPFLILAGLYGYLICMISFVICFLVALLVRTEQAYAMSVFLNAMFAIRCFRSIFGLKLFRKH